MFFSVSVSTNNNNIHIHNSYNIKKIRDMKHYINDIRNSDDGTCEVLNRSNFSLINEWRSHNLLYALGIFRTHTKDVDLESNPSIFFTIGYTILSFLYFRF